MIGVALISTVHAATGWHIPESGADVLAAMAGNERVPESATEIANKASALGYVYGFSDALWATGDICARDDGPPVHSDVKAALYAYFSAHPELAQKTEVGALLPALRKSFPCRK